MICCASFRNYSAKYKGDFYAQTTEKKMATIENAIQKKMKRIKGIVIGLFTMRIFILYQEFIKSQ
jgi:hypothetical protein